MRKLLASYFPFLVLVALIVMLWGRTASFDYLRFDDHDYTFRCDFVKGGLSAENIQHAFTDFTHAAVWMPLTYISYMADISVFGKGSAAHHAMNVVYHALVVILLLGFLRMLLPYVKIKPPCEGWFLFVLVAFWALHPQRVEAVAWIAARKDVLMTLFVLLALRMWVKGWHLCAIVFAVAASLSKPTAMCLPFLAGAVDIVKGEDWHSWDRARKWRHLASYGALFSVAAATGAIACYSQTHAAGYGVRELYTVSCLGRILNGFVSLGLGLFQMIFPWGIHLDYRAIPLGIPLGMVPGLLTLFAVVGGLGWLFWRLPRMRRIVVAAILFYGAAFLPTSGIFGSFGEQARADRFLYLPAIACTWLFLALPPKWISKIVWMLAGVMAVFVPITWHITSSYAHDTAVFERALACDPDHGRALAHTGTAHCAAGDMQEGIARLARSERLRPHPDTAAQLAYALARRGRSADFKIIERLGEAVAQDPTTDLKGQMLEALGVTAMRRREWQKAVQLLSASIQAPKRFYSDEDARLHLATSLYNAGCTTEAERFLLPLTRSSRADIKTRAEDAIMLIHDTKVRTVLFF